MKYLLLFFSIILCCYTQGQHAFNGSYAGANLSRIAFPLGGMGAGMLCLEGNGALSQVSIRHHPDLLNEPLLFAALAIRQIPGSARVLEGPVPDRKKFTVTGSQTAYGLARFGGAEFRARFPFGEVRLTDPVIPVQVTVTGWSPFIPSDADNSSLPVAALEYRFRNVSGKNLDAVFSLNSSNFLSGEEKSIGSLPGGFVLRQAANAFAVFTDAPGVSVDHCWFRGDWWDALTMAWKKISANDRAAVDPVPADAPGASLYAPLQLRPGEEKIIRVYLAWYVPESHLRTGVPVSKSSDGIVRDASVDLPSPFYQPWYSSRFARIETVIGYWKSQYASLRRKTKLFTGAFYRSTLPPEVLEAIAANLTILKSPTVMRQYDGRFWGWEGSNDSTGSCAGSCTHVWNYAQALAHLFPAMERTIRETEFNESLDSFGHQNYRAALPIRPAGHQYYLPAADGQLGSIMRAHRDWRICGDSAWIAQLYPRMVISMHYCIRTWDSAQRGYLSEPHHNTYDIEFAGAEPMCTGIYLGALEAMIAVGTFLHENISEYRGLLLKGKQFLQQKLFNGTYFEQQIEREEDSRIPGSNGDQYSPEAKALRLLEGPKYQYGKGCLSDGMIGAWEAKICGLPDFLDASAQRAHLAAVYTYNFKQDLSGYSNPQRPFYALGKEGGLFLCTWPRGGALSLPFVYSNEVWTGVEYEVASHLILLGKVAEGLTMIRALRRRYDGTRRNPFDEVEAGHWYARALSSYALLQALTGLRYDAVDRTLYVDSRVGDFVSFLSTEKGFGNVVYHGGKVKVEVVYGEIGVKKLVIKQKRLSCR